MRKIGLIFTFSLIFFSCEKDYLIPDKEVPEWLKIKIKQDEQLIKDSPQSWKNYGGWLRYKWQNEYYFEYHNVFKFFFTPTYFSKRRHPSFLRL